MTSAQRIIRILLTALLAFATAFAAFGCRSISSVLTPATRDTKETGPVPAPMDGGYYVATESFAALDNGYIFIEEPLPDLPWSTEEYAVIKEHGFISVLSKPFSTFGADIDTASYCNLRRMIRQGWVLDEIPAGAVRIEEMLNYFTYDYAGPQAGTGDLFGVTCTIADCPWSTDTKLLILGLQAKEAPVQSAGNNLVFLIDVSGSMSSENKLPLLKESFATLLENLDDNDTVSIVTYASGEEIVLEGAKAGERTRILAAIDSLVAKGATNGQAGLAQAYDVAARYFIPGGNNRIILASDGDLNVGITNMSDLEDFVAAKRDSGIYLSVLGFGDGNYKDTKMETIADNGNGAYYYIDCTEEAERLFGEDLTKTLVAVANDVKFQLEFNPAYVKGYRQIGYENRELSDDEFKDDKVDAGEVGSGAQITVAYELVMTDSGMELFTAESRYGAGNAGVENGEWFALSVRWKEPGSTAADTAAQRTYAFGKDSYTAAPGADWQFAAKVIQFGMVLTDSENLGTTDLGRLQEEVMAAHYTDARRAEFAKLVCRVM